MLQQPAAPASWQLDRERFAVHDYFGAAVAETRHELTDAAQAACMSDPDLSPGLDCCAVCARAAPPLRPKPKAGKVKTSSKGGEDAAAQLLECKGCHRVVYCGREHQLEDKPSHSPVCQVLSMIQSTDAVEVTPQRQGELIELFPRSCQELPPTLKDWCGVVPSHFAQVWRRRKKSEKQQAVASGAPQTKAGSSAAAVPAASPLPDAFLHVAELAVASSLLSYPLTLLACLRAGAGPPHAAGGAPAAPGAAGGQGGLRWAVPASRPLVVCVLGASEAAELAQPQVWQVLDGLHPGGVYLQFVGPEVPAAMHATTMQTGPSKGVTMAFFQGEYDRLAQQVLSAAGSRGGSRSDAAGTTKVKGAEGKRAAAGAKQPSVLPSALLLLPDVVLGFNMGLTCPEYNWLPTLKALKRISGTKRSGGGSHSPSSSGPPPPLRLVATCNTFVEAAMEDELLREDGGWSAERAVRANPFVCLELMQSGTLGNDVYRKNAWVACYELQAKPSVRELGKPGVKPKGGAGGGKKRSAQDGPAAKGGARGAGAGSKKRKP